MEEPAWKSMFKFWMDPKPNSFTWNEKARGEGTRTPDTPIRFCPRARAEKRETAIPNRFNAPLLDAPDS